MPAAEVENVCVVGLSPRSGADGDWVLLTSGADVSLLPRRLAGCGQPLLIPNVMISDAQGSEMNINGMRRATIEY